MSERGQKIFKCCVWIVIGLFMLISILEITYYTNNPRITKTEWMQMIEESFGIQDTDYIDKGGKEYATAEYATLTVMKAIGESSIEFMTGQTDLDDEQLVELAIEKDIITKSQKRKEISEAEAEEIMNKALSFYFDTENYPEYFEIDYACDVVDIGAWSISSFDEENNILHVSSLDHVPSQGQVIMPRDEFGIAKPRYVKECREIGNGQYEITLEKIAKPEELFNNISFSGKADFSYLLNASEGSSVDSEGISKMHQSEKEIGSMLNVFEPMTVYAADGEEESSNADIETGGTITAKVNNSGDETYEYCSYLKVEDGNNESKYQVTVDDKGKVNLEAVRNDVTLEAEHEANKVESDDKFEAESSVSNSISYKVKLSNLQITTAYRTTGDKFVDVNVSSDVELDWSIASGFEGKVPIAEFSLPIGATGLVRIDLRLYLVVEASGEVTLTYEMGDVNLGVRVASGEFLVPHSRDKESDNFYITAKVDVGIGFCGEVAVVIGDWLEIVENDIIDPGVEVMFEASAETLKNNEGFEEYPQCVQLKMAAPTVTFEASVGEDSLLYALLDLFELRVKTSYEFITAENAPFKKEYHIETDLNGKIAQREGSAENNCTHIILDAEESTMDPIELAQKRAEEAAKREAEAAKKKAQEEFNRALSEAIERWLVENCED